MNKSNQVKDMFYKLYKHIVIPLMFILFNIYPISSQAQPISVGDIFQFGSHTPCEIVDGEPTSGLPSQFQIMWENARQICSLSGSAEVDLERVNWWTSEVGMVVDSDILTILVKSDNVPTMCCSLSGGGFSEHRYENLWQKSYRVNNSEESSFSFQVKTSSDNQENNSFITYINQSDSILQKPFKGNISLKVIYSPEHDEQRGLFIYTPESYSKSDNYHILVLMDGETIFEFSPVIESISTSNDNLNFVIVGVNSQDGALFGEGEVGVRDLRSAEYRVDIASPSQRLLNHERFLMETVLPWVKQEFPGASNRENVSLIGLSDGAQFATWLSVRNSTHIGNALLMSPGRTLSDLRSELTRNPSLNVWVTAGEFELPFLQAAKGAASWLAAEGNEVTFKTYSAGHDISQWQRALGEYLGSFR